MTSSVGFDFVDRRVMAAVQRVAASDPNPADPFRGLYISDETALQLTHGESASGADDLPAPTRLRLVDLPAHDPGRHEHVAAVAAILNRSSTLPVVLCGPDAEALLAKALGRPLVVAHVRDMEVRDVMADAALISALE